MCCARNQTLKPQVSTVKLKSHFMTRVALLVLLLMPYLLYVSFIIKANRGPVDYETFMDIGNRLRAGEELWTTNSYYPMPYIMVFAAFSALPRTVSIALWHLWPLAAAALLITGGNPWVLAFAPLMAHVAGGQTSGFAMLGLWGYRRWDDLEDWRGGAWLALTTLKPQLGIFPALWAVGQWWAYLRRHKRAPNSLWAYVGTVALLYLPGFILIPDWPLRWLQQPRPLFMRALAGFIPRSLALLIDPAMPPFWIILIVLAAGLLALMAWLHKRLDFDLWMLWSFTANPLVHDYDLIQIIPLLETRALRIAALILSIPCWLVIVFAYANDPAWYVFSLIPPGLLLTRLVIERRTSLLGENTRTEWAAGSPDI